MSEFERITTDRAARVANYRTIVREYYRLVMKSYRRFWGDSYHFAIFNGCESREEALLTTEVMVARQGKFAPGMRLLDVGCGVGGQALVMADYSRAHVTGIDLCENKQPDWQFDSGERPFHLKFPQLTVSVEAGHADKLRIGLPAVTGGFGRTLC